MDLVGEAPVVVLTSQIAIPEGDLVTEIQTAQLNESLADTHRTGVTRGVAGVALEPQLRIAAQRAVLRFRPGVEGHLSAGERVPTMISVAGIEFVGIVESDLKAHQTTDLQAGLRPRNVEEASAIDVADTHIFHRFRLGNHDRIGRLGSRSAGHRRRR